MKGATIIMITSLAMIAAGGAFAQTGFASDSFKTAEGEVKISFIGHGTLMFEWAGKIIHIDPVSRYAKYDGLPKADLILVTHEHGDHLDPAAIAATKKPDTPIFAGKAVADKQAGVSVMAAGDRKTWNGMTIEAVAAYNTSPDRAKFHPKGSGNGFVLTIGGKRFYVAGDSENTPEMAALTDIEVAFLPMNLPYTMTPEQVAAAARAFRPKVLYPYHFGETKPENLVELLKDEKSIEVRIRNLQ